MTYVCPHCGEEHPDHFRLLELRFRGMRRDFLTRLLWASPRPIDHEEFMDKYDLGPDQLLKMVFMLNRTLRQHGFEIPVQKPGRRRKGERPTYVFRLQPYNIPGISAI